ncbi:uncharacterized protein LOC115219065 isoform X1 [Octopus sinensis]|uniref:Uncharacterized protein LOC115219065 isoform X1 n=1 Tax=Octopus sinensis TaxID=2607531 RepID=A0A6P7T554_9MOLL|nr:uncharacterized protein LOC115219065 isoform X1 [Octopus sinensis]XP_036364705.1 uncharacterized protein LOC115219065 isoform X1 [Octopus sinensis]XP_036364706.1 uncharacterized protein LOC115219065 isoform X1 [Octopus sinensis]
MEVKVDRSWAWMVLVAVFGIHFISGSLQYSSGIIRIALLQNTFSEDKELITWITSLYASLFSITGVLASILLNKIGCRKTVIIGSILQAIGFIGSYIVTDTKLLFLTLSVIAGTGCGICYTTAMVAISYHFDRYLGLASGIAVSAQGIGTIMINAIESTVNFYGLRNFFLLVAGYVLQNCVFGALLRTSEHERNYNKEVKNNKTVNSKVTFAYEQDVFDNELKSKPENLTIHSSDLQNTSNKLHQHETQYDCKEINLQIKDSKPESVDENSTDKTDRKLDQLSEKPNEEKSTVKIETKVNLDSRHIQSSGAQEMDVTGQPSNKFTTENRLQETTQVSNCNEKETCFEEYLKLVKDFRFMLFVLYVGLFASAESIIYILLPSYFIEKGTTKDQVAQLFTFVGIASTLTRFLTGVILNKNLLSLTVLFSVPSFLLAVCSFVVPFFIHIYWVQLIYGLLYGVLNFTVYALINKACIKLVGLKGTSSAMGIIMFLWGTAALIGSPLTEKVVLWTGSSDSSTAVIGTFYLLASIVVIPATYRS